MSTTIQIADTTKQILVSMKEKEHLNTYDEVIKHLAKKHLHIRKSMFGALKGARWKKEYRMDFGGE
ncbi:hypothetical protein HY484_00100 [Candidatus Woesearchaeota archaeon]|nr:hypothetical protein [Candidatus Woesearchaeota archaeon]